MFTEHTQYIIDIWDRNYRLQRNLKTKTVAPSFFFGALVFFFVNKLDHIGPVMSIFMQKIAFCVCVCVNRMTIYLFECKSMHRSKQIQIRIFITKS